MNNIQVTPQSNKKWQADEFPPLDPKPLEQVKKNSKNKKEITKKLPQTIQTIQEISLQNYNPVDKLYEDFEERKIEIISTQLTVDQVIEQLHQFLMTVVEIIETFEISLSSLSLQSEEEKEAVKKFSHEKVEKFSKEVKHFEEQHVNEALQTAQGLFNSLQTSQKSEIDLTKIKLLSQYDIKKASLEVQKKELQDKLLEIQTIANKIGTPSKKETNFLLQRKNPHNELYESLLELLYRVTAFKQTVKIDVLMVSYFSAPYSNHVNSLFQAFLQDFQSLRNDIKKMIPVYNKTKSELEKISSEPIDSTYEKNKDITANEYEEMWKSQKDKQHLATIQRIELEIVWKRLCIKVQHLLNQLNDYKAISDNNGSIPWGFSLGYGRKKDFQSPFDEYEKELAEKEKKELEGKIKEELEKKAKQEMSEKIKKEMEAEKIKKENGSVK